MRIDCIGGGPAGLFFAILMKKAFPGHAITVHERNAADDTFGWGVVFSDATLENLEEADAETYAEITRSFARWEAVEIKFKGRVLRSGGHGFCGIARRHLLNILQARARGLGVALRFKSEVAGLDALRGSDLVVACDGVNSALRAAHADAFRPTLGVGRAKYIWLGTNRLFEAFTFLVAENRHGLFQVHAYRFDAHTSTFIAECDEASWRRAGLDAATTEESVAYLEELFAADLHGHPLLTNRASWINFLNVSNETWRHGNLVLMGDAAHTAHFSIGTGTKLAMEDAIALAARFRERRTLPDALAAYEEERKPAVERLQRVAGVSQAWFEEIARYRGMEPAQFGFALMTRSRKVTHGNLALRDRGYVASLDRWFVSRTEAAGTEPPPPPMFTPLRLRGLLLENRVVCSPMCMYSAEEGTVADWHLVHLGSRAVGGAGLVISEMTDVSRLGRITPGCAGMYEPRHAAAWRRVTDFVHGQTRAKIALQLAHAGRKGSTKLMWDGIDLPLDGGNWPLLSASSIPYLPQSQVPKAMDRSDMGAVRDDFVRAARLAVDAGFDMLELHMAHGYLLASFLSPLTNVRRDSYGGALANRMRYPLEVFDAVRAAWPAERPISVRISAHDWAPGGLLPDDAVQVARMLKEHGCDIIDVSSGQTTPDAEPVYGRLFQTPFSDRIRNEAGIPTMAVGAITNFDEVNTILLAGRADLCVLARAHLGDPYWTLHAAAAQGYAALPWPKQYLAVKPRPR
ncbi:MAG: bifunctional salicylyl-CoA 5-hydroxylase/oxidoreductase [Planctomycetaceae bacterium]